MKRTNIAVSFQSEVENQAVAAASLKSAEQYARKEKAKVADLKAEVSTAEGSVARDKAQEKKWGAAKAKAEVDLVKLAANKPRYSGKVQGELDYMTTTLKKAQGAAAKQKAAEASSQGQVDTAKLKLKQEEADLKSGREQRLAMQKVQDGLRTREGKAIQDSKGVPGLVAMKVKIASAALSGLKAANAKYAAGMKGLDAAAQATAAVVKKEKSALAKDETNVNAQKYVVKGAQLKYQEAMGVVQKAKEAVAAKKLKALAGKA